LFMGSKLYFHNHANFIFSYGISWSSCQRILTEELHMKRLEAKFVPRLLTPDLRDNRLAAYGASKEHLETDPDFFSKVITGDESWCYGYDPETKQQSSQWKEFVPQGQTVNHNYYLEILKRLLCSLGENVPISGKQVNGSFIMTTRLPTQR
ncbi:hypothetical protein B7P43_G11369, partial [Cryptotermes secundus]